MKLKMKESAWWHMKKEEEASTSHEVSQFNWHAVDFTSPELKKIWENLCHDKRMNERRIMRKIRNWPALHEKLDQQASMEVTDCDSWVREKEALQEELQEENERFSSELSQTQTELDSFHCRSNMRFQKWGVGANPTTLAEHVPASSSNAAPVFVFGGIENQRKEACEPTTSQVKGNPKPVRKEVEITCYVGSNTTSNSDSH